MHNALLSSQQIIDCIIKRNYESNNESKLLKNLKRSFNHIWIGKLDNNIGTNSGHNFLRIDQLKSFYNLKYDERKGIISNITSDFNHFMIVKDFKGESPTIEYNKNFQKLPKEKNLENSLVINIDYLKSKRLRIESYKKNIIETLQLEDNLNRSNSMSTQNQNIGQNSLPSMSENDTEILIPHTDANNEKPLFCKDTCLSCLVTPKYKDMLNNGIKPNQTEVNHELSQHNHPSCRRYNKSQQKQFGLQRSAEQGRKELLDHYNYCH